MRRKTVDRDRTGKESRQVAIYVAATSSSRATKRHHIANVVREIQSLDFGAQTMSKEASAPTRRSMMKPLGRAREKYHEQRPRVQQALDAYWLEIDNNKPAPTVRSLAGKYEIRKSFLGQLIKEECRIVPEKKPGVNVSLPYVMECILAVWILTQQAIGYSVTSEEARRKAAALQRAVSQTAPAMKCYRWLKGFLKRFPFINVRAASSTSKVLGAKGSKNAHRPGSSYSECILDEADDGTAVCMTPQGWTNDKVFGLWMDHFIKHTQKFAKPLLRLLDGHGSQERFFNRSWPRSGMWTGTMSAGW